MSFEKKWSICICHVPIYERISSLEKLVNKLLSQIDNCNLENEVEILIETDNQVVSVGEKRNMLIEKAKGEYICFVDDDDSVCENYVSQIYQSLHGSLDLILIKIIHEVNGVFNRIIVPHPMIETQINESYFTKNYFHLCPHKTSLAKEVKFKPINFMEDIDYTQRIYELVKKFAFLDEPMYKYNDQLGKSLTR